MNTHTYILYSEKCFSKNEKAKGGEKKNGKNCNLFETSYIVLCEKIEINDDNEMQNTDKLTGSFY